MQGLAGSPGSDSFKRLQSKCWPGLQSSQGSNGGGFVSKLIYMLAGRIHFLVGLIDLKGFSFLLGVSHRTPSIPCHVGLSIGQFKTRPLASLEQVSSKNQREQD